MPKERKHKANFIIPQETFGKLTVLMHLCITNSIPKYLCVCSCGTKIVTSGYSLVGGKSTTCGSGKCREKRKIKPVMERFWEKVSRPIGNGGCWIWCGAKNKKGYGSFGISGISYLATHIAYEWHHNTKLPKNTLLMHSCDNPSCVNPSHLSIGTTKENSDDMIRKGRSSHGVVPGNAKLHIDDIESIKNLYRHGLRQKDIGDQFGVVQQTISAVITGDSWTNIKKESL